MPVLNTGLQNGYIIGFDAGRREVTQRPGRVRQSDEIVLSSDATLLLRCRHTRPEHEGDSGRVQHSGYCMTVGARPCVHDVTSSLSAPASEQREKAFPRFAR